MAEVDLKHAIGLKPKDAIAYFEAKGFRLSGDWHEVWREANAQAFTVAHLAKMDVLQDIHGALRKSLAQGKTERWFVDHLTPVLQAKGWWGKAIDQDTGEITETYPGTSRPVQYGSPRRLKLIYRQNMQSAYMAGRWKAMRDNADQRPFWQYVAVMDSRTRPAHAALNGKVFRFDDPIWQYLFPPNGWSCRCRVRALTERQVSEMGLRVESSDGRIDETEIEVGRDEAGHPISRPVKRLRYTDPVDGREKYFIPDAGWDYNPGMAAAADTALWQRADALFEPDARDTVLAGIASSGAQRAAYSGWIDAALARGTKRGEAVTIGYMAATERDYMAARGHVAATGAILLEDRLLVGKKARRHEAQENALSAEEWKKLPDGIAAPEATLHDVRNGTLLYIFSAIDDGRKIKVVVEVGRWESKLKSPAEITRTVFKVDSRALIAGVNGGQYMVIRGGIE